MNRLKKVIFLELPLATCSCIVVGSAILKWVLASIDGHWFMVDPLPDNEYKVYDVKKDAANHLDELVRLCPKRVRIES